MMRTPLTKPARPAPARPAAVAVLGAMLLAMLLAACVRPDNVPPAEAQRLRGAERYRQQCAACHGAESAEGPALTRDLLAAYGTADALFFYVQMAMPPQAPGHLADADYWAVVAFLLHDRALHTAARPLDAATAAGVVMTTR